MKNENEIESLAKAYIAECAANSQSDDCEDRLVDATGLDADELVSIVESCDLTDEVDAEVAVSKIVNAAKRKSEKTIVYEIWIVENGSLTEFGRGWDLQRTATANMCWGNCCSIDEVKEKLHELADENFRREGGEYDRIWDECAEARPEEADEGFSEPEIACEKYCKKCADSFGFEWHDDLKWIRVRKMLEDGNGDRTFVEVL